MRTSQRRIPGLSTRRPRLTGPRAPKRADPGPYAGPPVSILGIDPGLRTTGFAALILDGTVRRWELCRDMRVPTTVPPGAALAMQVEGLRRVLVEMRPQRVAIESYDYQGRRTEHGGSLDTARMVGVLEGVARALVPEVVTHRRVDILRAIGLTGACGKSRVLDWAHAFAREAEPRHDHEADAVCVAWVASMQLLRRLPRTA